MQLKIAFLLMFPCLVGAQVYNPLNNLPSSASFPGHNAMGASGAINTGQWDQGFGPQGPTRNLLNLQETDTTADGENGVISIVNWSPSVTATAFQLVSGIVGQANGNFDAQATDSNIVRGSAGFAVSNGATRQVEFVVGSAGYSAAKGAAPIVGMLGLEGGVYLEAGTTAGSVTGVNSFIEGDVAVTVTDMSAFTANIFLTAGSTVTNAYGFHITAPTYAGSTVTHPYAFKSDDPSPSAFAGLIATSKGGAVTSATSITPTGQIFHVTGTTAVATIVAPAGCTDANQGCQLTLIPDAAFTTTAAGNIALASTAVLNKALIMTYDSGTSKWYPSY